MGTSMGTKTVSIYGQKSDSIYTQSFSPVHCTGTGWHGGTRQLASGCQEPSSIGKPGAPEAAAAATREEEAIDKVEKFELFKVSENDELIVAEKSEAVLEDEKSLSVLRSPTELDGERVLSSHSSITDSSSAPGLNRAGKLETFGFNARALQRMSQESSTVF